MRGALRAVATGSALLLAAGLAQAQAPATVLAVNDTRFRVGETLALELTAQAFINQVLAGPPLPAALTGRLERLAGSVATIDALVPVLADAVLVGPAQRLALSFRNVRARCPADLLAAIMVNGETGTITSGRDVRVPITRACEFSVAPPLVSRKESTVTFVVLIKVLP